MATDLDKFIREYHDALPFFARGNPAHVMRLFSHGDDVVLANPFGPAVCGWEAARERLSSASSSMHDGDVAQVVELARYESSDLVVLHETEWWSARIAERHDVEPFVLRVTTTFRREEGEWKIVHRHADPIADVNPHGPLRGK